MSINSREIAKKAAFVCIGLLISLQVACAPSFDEEKKKDSSVQRNVANEEVKMTVVPHKEEAEMGPNVASIFGAWYVDYQGNDISMRSIFNFRGQDLVISNTCYFPRGLAPVSVNIQLAVKVTATSFEILNSDEKETVVDQNGITTRCRVSASRASIYYKIVGQTLRLSQPGNSQELVLTKY